MDIAVQSGTPRVSASRLSASRQADGYTPEMADRISKGLELASIVSDTSGKHSFDEQASAYDSLFGKIVTGEFTGWSDQDRKVVEFAIGSSGLGKRMREIQEEAGKILLAASQASGNAAKAFGSYYDNLSQRDKKLFALEMNPTNMYGKKNYEDITQWRVDMQANADLFEYLNKAKSTEFVKAEGAKYDRIMGFIADRDNSRSVGWGSALLKLLEAPVDRVDLSHEAKSVVRLATGPTENAAPVRAQGTLLDTSV